MELARTFEEAHKHEGTVCEVTQGVHTKDPISMDDNSIQYILQLKGQLVDKLNHNQFTPDLYPIISSSKQSFDST